jgi:hypothetical protein
MRMSGRHSLDLCGPDDGLGAYTIHTYKKKKKQISQISL